MAGLLTAVETDRDQQLLAMHLSGDRAAFGELYARHHERLFRHVRARVQDWHLAEEIVQDAFLRAYEAATHLQDRRRFYPWLTVIANRLAIDAFRRSGRVSPVAQFDPDLGEEPAADEALISAAEAEALHVALGRVRERHRQVLSWQTQGLSYEVIARKLDAAPTTVAPLLFRARQALRREYLAVTEAERIAAVPVLGAVVATVRRWRLRGSQLASYVPEPGMFSAQFATVILVIGSGLGYGELSGVQFQDAWRPVGAAEQGVGARGDTVPAASAPQVHVDQERNPAEGPAGDLVLSPPKVVGVGGPDRARAMHQARNAPYRAEVGPVGFGLDPAGDTRYVRDAVVDAGAP